MQYAGTTKASGGSRQVVQQGIASHAAVRLDRALPDLHEVEHGVVFGLLGPDLPCSSRARCGPGSELEVFTLATSRAKAQPPLHQRGGEANAAECRTCTATNHRTGIGGPTELGRRGASVVSDVWVESFDADTGAEILAAGSSAQTLSRVARFVPSAPDRALLWAIACKGIALDSGSSGPSPALLPLFSSAVRDRSGRRQSAAGRSNACTSFRSPGAPHRARSTRSNCKRRLTRRGTPRLETP